MRRMKPIAILLIIFASGSSVAQGSCNFGWSQYGIKCYILIDSIGQQIWYDAKLQCVGLSATLPLLTSKTEAVNMYMFMRAESYTGPAPLGIEYSGGAWVYIDNGSVAWTNWAANEPSGGLCAWQSTGSNGYITDECQFKTFPKIACEQTAFDTTTIQSTSLRTTVASVFEHTTTESTDFLETSAASSRAGVTSEIVTAPSTEITTALLTEVTTTQSIEVTTVSPTKTTSSTAGTTSAIATETTPTTSSTAAGTSSTLSSAKITVTIASTSMEQSTAPTSGPGSIPASTSTPLTIGQPTSYSIAPPDIVSSTAQSPSAPTSTPPDDPVTQTSSPSSAPQTIAPASPSIPELSSSPSTSGPITSQSATVETKPSTSAMTSTPKIPDPPNTSSSSSSSTKGDGVTSGPQSQSSTTSGSVAATSTMSASTTTLTSNMSTWTNTRDPTLKMRPNDPMSPGERMATKVMHIMGCTHLLGCVGGVFAFGVITSFVDYERHLPASQEAALIIKHILILYGHDYTGDESQCRWTSILIHFFSLAYFLFLLLEAWRSYAIVTSYFTRMDDDEIYSSIFIGWVTPLLVVIPASLAYFYHYNSDFSCWLNTGHRVSLFTIIPVVACLLATIVLFEASGIRTRRLVYHPNSEMEDAYQSAVVALTGLVVITPLSVASWAFGFAAVYHQRVELYALAFAFNVALGVAIVIFHGVNNPKIRRLMIKIKRAIFGRVMGRRREEAASD